MYLFGTELRLAHSADLRRWTVSPDEIQMPDHGMVAPAARARRTVNGIVLVYMARRTAGEQAPILPGALLRRSSLVRGPGRGRC